MSKQNDTILLKSFNRRNPNAFSIVYRMIYRELYLYATRLFDPLNLPAEDVIQDIFTDIWLRESVQFPSILYIKTFCFIALKNAYKNKIKHQGYQQRFELECKVEKEFTDDIEQVEPIPYLVRIAQIPTRRLRHGHPHVPRRLETRRDRHEAGPRPPNSLQQTPGGDCYFTEIYDEVINYSLRLGTK